MEIKDAERDYLFFFHESIIIIYGKLYIYIRKFILPGKESI